VKRYVVPGWPRAVNGHSAVTPGLTRYAGSGAQAYKDRVTGEPGTLPVAVAPVVPSPDVGDLALAGISRSGDAANSIRPNLYYARPEAGFWPGAGMPVSVTSDNLMPVPAVDPRGIPAMLAQPVVQRGSRQVRQVPALPQWAAW
jgi:hypothetical protein